MSSASAAEVDVHSRLIRETFIDPIRTVIIVDDEYPTLDNMTAKELGDVKNWSIKKEENIPRVREFLALARSRERPWLIDVYDANGLDQKSERCVASHLHLSDLLVLDYHLQGDTGGGDAAIDILRDLANGDHFNLVIVHTKGNAGDYSSVVREIALGLTHSDLTLSPIDNQANLALDQWDDLDEGVVLKLMDEISSDMYLQLRNENPVTSSKIYGTPEGKRILDAWKARPPEIKIDSAGLAKWLLAKKQEQLDKKFSPIKLGNVRVGSTNDINWILTEKLFVTVLPKTCEPREFEDKLLSAIKASFPSPHRLLLARIRAEIEKQGLSAEASILGNRYLQAEWLSEFLNQNPIDTTAVIHNTVNRHWESLGDQLRLSVGSFTKQLQEYFSTLGVDSVMAQCGLNKSDIGSVESLKRFNCYASTKPFDRAHLTTGHVFRMNQTVGGEMLYWVCLSPACDMVPRQEETGDNLSFIAVRLHSFKDDRPIKNATKNIFLFVEIENEIETFCIHEDGIAQNPDWQQMLAKNKAKFHEVNRLYVSSIVEANGNPALVWSEATVISQLRSEYALNLLQRVGALLTRPGLGMNFKQRT